jgi:hypothetical protein
VKRWRVLLCLLPCGSDALCSATCLQKYAELSPWVGTTIGCLTILGRSDTPDDAILDLCLRETSTETSTFQAGIVGGLSSLAACSLDSCKDTHSNFVTDFQKISRCTEACSRLKLPSDNKENPIFSLVLPSGLACTLQCTLFA